MSFVAEVTSDVESDNWSGRFFSRAQQRTKKMRCWIIMSIIYPPPNKGAIKKLVPILRFDMKCILIAVQANSIFDPL